MLVRGRHWLATGALLAAVAACAAGADAAVSVTNRDDKDHKLTLVEADGATKTDHTLKPNQVLEGVCAKGCILRLNDSEEDEYELEGTEIVSIEDGYLYYDLPEGQPDKPAAGAATTPAPGAGPSSTPPPAKK